MILLLDLSIVKALYTRQELWDCRAGYGALKSDNLCEEYMATVVLWGLSPNEDGLVLRVHIDKAIFQAFVVLACLCVFCPGPHALLVVLISGREILV